MFDLVIRSDRVATPAGVESCDVAIDGEKIVAVASAGTFGSDSTRRLIDATGKIVMPGGIDPHVHCKWYSPHPDFKVVARERGMCVMHGEDNDIVMHMYDKLIREGRVGFENMAEVHNAMSEDLSFRRVLGLARNVPGIALYFMHVSAAFGADAVREARARGMPVYNYSPWEGHQVHAWPSLTVLRGKVVVENGNFLDDLADGQYLYRKISDEIRSGAML